MDTARKADIEVKASTARFINPSKCRMWSLHARSEESIDAKSCDSLIESIRKHGQRHPVLGRRALSRDGNVTVELIYGARRLFAAQQLGIDLLVDIREVDDRTALLEMDLENRAREDISPYERGINYSRWLRGGHFRNQAELASELGISEAQVSRLLQYAELPTAVVAAFKSVRDIREEWAVALAQACRDPEGRQEISRRARQRAQAGRFATSAAFEIYEALLNGVRSGIVRQEPREEVITSDSGRPLFRIAFRAKTLHLILPRERLATELLQKIKKELSVLVEEHYEAPAKRSDARQVKRPRSDSQPAAIN